jgi:hypothetical protein
MNIRLNGQNLTSNSFVNRTGIVRITLDCGSALFQRFLRTGQNVFALAIEGGGHAVPGELRELNFQVSRIGFVDDASVGKLEVDRR